MNTTPSMTVGAVIACGGSRWKLPCDFGVLLDPARIPVVAMPVIGVFEVQCEGERFPGGDLRVFRDQAGGRCGDLRMQCGNQCE